MRSPFACLALVCLSVPLGADVVPAPLFTDNAVLQRDKPIPVWGTADAGEKISVTFAGQTISTVADASGKWRGVLPPLSASATPAELVIKGNNTITLANILVGDVWLASGQSNMEWTVDNSYDRAIDVPASARFPDIRHIKIKRTRANTPAATVAIDEATWQVAGPSTTGDFSAVGYYFAKDVHALTGVPIGIITSTWGGTPIEPWISPDALTDNPGLAFVHKRWAQYVTAYPQQLATYNAQLAAWRTERDAAKSANLPFKKSAPRKPDDPAESARQPSALNHGMIAPLVPSALRGVIWYQGESNALRPSDYRALFSALITGWRTQFAQGDLPFYWVQLANFQSPGEANWAGIREAQTQTLALPNTGQAVTVDIGNVADIHPRNKKDVGRRLARVALARTYGQKIVDSGPVFAKAEREGAGFRVRFTETHGGLIAPLQTLGGFELAGEDKVFKSAEAKIENDTVIVTCAEIAAPVAVRYAWRNAPLAGLFNKEGLPAVPFRTDTW
jgi:sialate O-acetylesterase